MIFLLIQTLIFFLLFATLSFFVFYITGFTVIINQKKILKDQEIIALSLSLGMIFFVLLAIILGLCNLRWLVLPFLFVVCLLTILKYKWETFSPWKLFAKDRMLLFLIVLGILIQGFINFPSGYLYKDGLKFWSSQGHDGLWHVSLMEEISKNFPPQNPIYSGEKLYNYHFLVDVLMGEFHRIFPFFSSLDLYFRFFPVVLSFLIGISVFAFVKRWQNNHIIGYLALFFTYFVGSFGYIVLYIKYGKIFGGETIFWAAQINTILGNPPHAISIGFMSSFFLSFYFFIKERNKFWFLISALLALILSGFKVSAGLTLLIGLGAAAFFNLIFNHRWTALALFAILGVSNFITIELMTRGAASFLMFLPWWFVRTMVVAKLGWIDLELRRQHYLAQETWHATLRVIQLEAEAFAIFFIGNLGMRIIGFFEQGRRIWKNKKNFLKDPLEVLLFITMWTGFLIPLLFVQRGIIYNNIQFMQYFLLIFGFYAAISTDKLIGYFKSRVIKVIVLFFIVALSVPTVFGNLVEFYGGPPLAKITNMELQALNFLKENSKSGEVVLNTPFNKYLQSKFDKQPWPIYAWYSTSYIPALSGLTTYLSSEEQALITGYTVDKRLEKMKAFFRQDDLNAARFFLQDNKIDYIYLAKGEIETPILLDNKTLEVFFENDEVIIYKVRKV